MTSEKCRQQNVGGYEESLTEDAVWRVLDSMTMDATDQADFGFEGLGCRASLVCTYIVPEKSRGSTVE
jgi:hypothetical protein